jgi:hydroxymethylglutaryl-CoA lyase
MGLETGIDLAAVLDASRLVAALVGHPVPSRVAQAGPRRSGHAVV